VRHDRIDLPRRQTHSRTLLAVLPLVLILLLLETGRDPSVLWSLLVLLSLRLVLRHLRGWLIPRGVRGGNVATLPSHAGLEPADRQQGATGDNAHAGREGSEETQGANFSTETSEPAEFIPDSSDAPGTADPKTVRVRERRRNARKQLPEPPAAKFVMVAPGRYVRLEESETTQGAIPSTDAAGNDDRPGHDTPVGDEPADDHLLDENAPTEGGLTLPSDAVLDTLIAPGEQSEGEISPDPERSAEPPGE
jgi:hypothetical protein